MKYRLVVTGDSGLRAEDVVPGSLRWSQNGKLVLQSRASRRETDWVIAGGASLTSSFQTPPSTLAPTTQGNGFAAVADGRLWLIDTGGAAPRVVNPEFKPRIDAMAWSDGWIAVVSAGADLYVIDLKTAEFRRLARPAPDAEFRTFVPQTGVAVFSTVTRGGTHLWISGRKLASANEFLAQIAEGSLRKVEYHGLDGQSLHHMVFAESGQFRMGAAPWKDMDRYIRNSPITYADRVTTPVLIVQGDMDYVPLQQGEEFFTALYRQNKPASFVRYWGEGHIIESPANVADMWAKICAWLMRYLT